MDESPVDTEPIELYRAAAYRLGDEGFQTFCTTIARNGDDVTYRMRWRKGGAFWQVIGDLQHVSLNALAWLDCREDASLNEEKFAQKGWN